jgi:Rod binding domain-containing protein
MQITATSPETIPSRGPREDPAKVDDAARQFEALLIGGMLKSAREADEQGFMGSGSDGASDTALSMADEQLAQAMASRGGLGLAKLISERLFAQDDTGAAAAQGVEARAATSDNTSRDSDRT